MGPTTLGVIIGVSVLLGAYLVFWVVCCCLGCATAIDLSRIDVEMVWCVFLLSERANGERTNV
jgi:hypothetical protein